MAKILKSEVDTKEKLLAYLKEQATSEKVLYHYTTYDSLIKILKGKAFRLSSLNKLNDKKEKDFTDDKYYIMSFTPAAEYVSMWSMYGNAANQKIRISLDSKCLRSLLRQENIYEDELLQKKYYSSSIPLFEVEPKLETVLFSDVTYIDSVNKKYCHKTNPFNLLDVCDVTNKYMGGLVKYNAWEFERETRIRVMGLGDNLQVVYLKVSDELLGSISITFNPWMSDTMKDIIRESLNKYGIKCFDSLYDGQIE